MGFKDSHPGRGTQPPLPGFDPVEAALTHLGAGLARKDNIRTEPFTTFPEFDAVQQTILTQYDREVLEPQRPMWAFMQELLARGPYTHATISSPPKIGWKFDHPTLRDIGNGRLAQVAIQVEVTLDSAMPESAFTLIRHLAGEPLIDEASLLLKASRNLEMPIPTFTRRRFGRESTTDLVPSKDNLHQKATEVATDHIELFSASVIATVEGEENTILSTSLNKKELEKPKFITGKFRVPYSATSIEEFVPLSPNLFRTFLLNWRRDRSTITKEPPSIETLLEFLTNQMDWNPKNFANFDSVLNLINESSLATIIGDPKKS